MNRLYNGFFKLGSNIFYKSKNYILTLDPLLIIALITC